MAYTTTGTFPRDPQTAAIIEAAIEVHKELGRGFVEPVYRWPLEFEFTDRQIPFRREVGFQIEYKGRPTGLTYRVDFLCFEEVIVEIKALKALTGVEQAQLLNYLRASGMKRGLLLNFGAPKLECRRLVW